MRKPFWIVFFLLAVLTAQLASPDTKYVAANPTDSGQPAALSPLEPQDFHLVSSRSGWALAGGRLIWSRDGGETWKEITPPLADERILSVRFTNDFNGWVLSQPTALTTGLHLFNTTDAGRAWSRQTLALTAPEDAEFRSPAAVYMEWLDARRGWLVLQKPSSLAFSIGRLLRTSDGGSTWERLDVPFAAPLRFITDKIGFTAGGASGDGFYRTTDGGASWQPAVLPGAAADGQASSRPRYLLPVFDNSANGLLAVIRGGAESDLLSVYHTADGGAAWALLSEQAVPAAALPGTPLPVFLPDAHHWIVLDQASGTLRRYDDTQSVLPPAAGATALPPGTQRVEAPAPAGSASGLLPSAPNPTWALAQTTCPSGDCPAQLVVSQNGGKTWHPAAFPNLPARVSPPESGKTTAVTSAPESPRALPLAPAAALTLPASVSRMYDQGFDNCSKPSQAQLQAWMDSSPFVAWNIYMGGSNAACDAPYIGITADYIRAAAQQGWRFIFTWVGPQARYPTCLSKDLYNTYIYTNTTDAYNQGKSEGEAAIQSAISLGLVTSDGSGNPTSGTLIYYDLEAYSAIYRTQECRDAAKAFINGWTYQLHTRGSLSGVYGSASGSALADFAGIPNLPDAIWIASYDFTSYTEYHSILNVWNFNNLANALWANHQRIYQYAGGHNETWGGSTINIDDNLLDGLVALPVGLTPAVCPQSGGVIVYAGAGYSCAGLASDSGYRQYKSSPDPTYNKAYNLSDTGAINDQVSAVQVRSGWSARVFQDIDAGGASLCLTSSISDLATLGNFPGTAVPVNNNISSVTVHHDSHCGSLPAAPYNPSPMDATAFERSAAIALSWTTDGTSCTVHLWGGSGLDLSVPGQSCSTSFPVGQLHGGTYNWQISSTNATGTSLGPVWSFTVKPAGVSEVVVTPQSSTAVLVSWALSPDDTADASVTGVDNYDVYRGDGTLLTSVPARSTGASITGLDCRQSSYSFYVITRRQGILSNPSAAVSGAPTTCTDLVIQSMTVSPLRPDAGQPLSVSIQLRNAGTLAAGPFDLNLYADHQPSGCSDPAAPARSASVAGLAPGGSISLVIDLPAFPDTLPHTIWALENASCAVAEVTLTNNAFTVLVNPLSTYFPWMTRQAP